MPSWETYDTNLNEQYHRDFVLKQPSTVGPWIALGLGVTLLAFLGSSTVLILRCEVSLTSPSLIEAIRIACSQGGSGFPSVSGMTTY